MMEMKKVLISIVVALVLVNISNLAFGHQSPEYQLSSTQGDKIQKPCGMGDVIYSFDSPSNLPIGLTWDGTYLWNADDGTGKIYKIDPSNGNIVKSYNAPEPLPHGLAWDGTYLWSSDNSYETKKIYKLYVGTYKLWVVKSFDTPGPNQGDLAWDGTYLWHADSWYDKIYKIDPSNGNVIYSFDSPDSEPTGLAWDGTYLWHADATFNNWLPGKIYKIDPSNGNVIYSFDSPGPHPEGLAWDGTYLWNVDRQLAKIYKIDVGGAPPPPPDEPPKAKYVWEDADGSGAETVINFDASCSTDDNGIVSYEWDWTSDGTYDATGKIKSHDYGNTNSYSCTLRVTDTIGQTNTVTKTVHASVGGDIILTEGFESGVMPPTGWTVQNSNPTEPWRIISKAELPQAIHGGNYAAIIYSNYSKISDNWLVSPYLDLTGYPNVNLEFWVRATTKYPGATICLCVSSGGSWEVIWDMVQDEDWQTVEYRKMTFSLNEYIGKTIRIAWQYKGENGPIVALDDIIVTDPNNGGGSQQQSQQQSQPQNQQIQFYKDVGSASVTNILSKLNSWGR